MGKVSGRPFHSRMTDGFKRKRGRLTGSLAGRGNTGKFVKFDSQNSKNLSNEYSKLV